MTNHTTTKVLPFTTEQGDVNGHEIRRFHPLWLEAHDPIECIAFETFSEAAGGMVQTLVHWTRFTTYTKKTWPKSGSIPFVTTKSGRKIFTTSLAFIKGNEWYMAAPLVCRDAYKIVTLGNREPLIEVVGVEDYARNGKSLVDPWERDNAAFAARTSSTHS